MPTIKIPRETMEDLLYSDQVVEDKIVSKSRWTINRTLVFKYDSKVYRTKYQEGATELQEYGPWEDEAEVECVEVKPVTKQYIEWEPV